MDKIITVRKETGEKSGKWVEEGWSVSSPFIHFQFSFLLPVGISIKPKFKKPNYKQQQKKSNHICF